MGDSAFQRTAGVQALGTVGKLAYPTTSEQGLLKLGVAELELR